MSIMESQTLFEDEKLRLRALVGQSDTLVVAFTGIGHKMGTNQRNEFAGTASNERENSVIFVADLLRSWFSHPGMIERLADIISDYAVTKGVNNVLSIGNSMGGFGAMLLPAYLDIDVAIAFSPQFTMNTDIVPEQRWSKFRPNMHGPNLWTISEKMVDKTRYFALFGADHPGDRLHAEAFPERENLCLRRISHSDHNVAADMRRAGHLKRIIDAMFAGDVDAVDEIISAFESNPPQKVDRAEKLARKRAILARRRAMQSKGNRS